MEPEFEEHSWWENFKNNFADLIQFVAIVGAILVAVRFFVAEPHKVEGSSMIPNFQNGDYIITNKIGLRFTTIQRGEVIILQNPRNTTEDFIKRVIALPGDRIKLADGNVYINGQLLSEPYLPPGTETYGGAYLPNDEEIVIPDNQYFVMGDNRTGSSDSREWGTVNRDLIIGQAWLRYWPPQEFMLIKIDAASH
ncbi:signal peptidase I [Patescibacteria group bacterium]|nr:signal peptidase I [Patescibacteria group bacterium]